MRGLFYPKIAWSGMKNNRRIYLPYVLTCIGMVMMYYIILFLSRSDTLDSIKGGSVMREMLSFGAMVLRVFILIFLFYTNSFLIRRRKKEFGLYNILGMGKWNLARIVIWETVILAASSLAAGMGAGLLLSKLAELGMVNLLEGDINYTLYVDPEAILQTMIVFGVIFGLILLNTLRQIGVSNPVELLRSETVGERPPKGNWLIALLGAGILGAAYYIAVTIEDPLSAMLWFFVAVAMVIVATYLLFIAGSVVICRLLQKNKKYYYKANHFISVSSMVYRMKRNGAGLASICILSTIVLVMISATGCLYVGKEASLRQRYPRQINVEVRGNGTGIFDPSYQDPTRGQAEQAVKKHGQTMENLLDYRTIQIAGILDEKEGRILTDSLGPSGLNIANTANLWVVYIVPLEDYNRLTGEQETLGEDEVLLHTSKAKWKHDTVTIGALPAWRVKREVEAFAPNGVDAMATMPGLFLVTADIERTSDAVAGLADWDGEPAAQYVWDYLFDIPGDEETQIALTKEFWEEKLFSSDEDVNRYGVRGILVESVAQMRADFYSLYSGLFFLGIFLGLVFLFATVMIMYYKQTSEGYEDQARFEVMQKVGMTKRDIRRSVNSQILTVFFLPLLAAGVHLAFAFPIVRKILLMFGLLDTKLLILVSGAWYLMFAVFYVLMYQVTSRAYYSIVSTKK